MTDKVVCSNCGHPFHGLTECPPLVVGDEDVCRKTKDGSHKPDINTLAVTYDEGEVYIDISCSACGHSGCVGKLDLKIIDW